MIEMERQEQKEKRPIEGQADEFVNSFPIQKVKVDDIEIQYKIIGPERGKPIILVPGLKVTMDMWEPIILKALALSDYGVIVFNNRGTGGSSIGDKEYSIGQLANDAAGLLDALSINRADVLGWSMGSYIAQDLALIHPSKVNDLILYGSGPGGEKAIPSNPQLMQTLNNISVLLKSKQGKFFPCFFLKFGFNRIQIT